MYYLDSNVFIMPILYEGARSSKALEFLKKVISGEIVGATSTLTLDEVVWIVSRKADREIALREARRIMGFPHLKILDVKKADVRLALDRMEMNRKLSPRDAIHLSVALNNGIIYIVSDDEDFSSMEDINHISLVDRMTRQ